MANKQEQVVWWIPDGKPGHENQVLGLLEGLKKLLHLQIYKVSELSKNKPQPDLIVSAGHSTHWRLLKWGWKFKAKTVLLMKPSLPVRFFDLCFIPEHDLKDRDYPNVISTQGVMNRIQPGAKKDIGLILLGGESKEFAWDEEGLKEKVESIVKSDSSVHWKIGDSRRTPEGFLKNLNIDQSCIYPHGDMARGWLPRQLSEAKKCWVTEDSVSMVYEALTSGAVVGLLPMIDKGKSGRVSKGIKALVSQKMLTLYDKNEISLNEFLLKKEPLSEASRCAKILIQRFTLGD